MSVKSCLVIKLRVSSFMAIERLCLPYFIQIGQPIMSIFKVADLRHLEIYGSNNGFFEKLM